MPSASAHHQPRECMPHVGIVILAAGVRHSANPTTTRGRQDHCVQRMRGSGKGGGKGGGRGNGTGGSKGRGSGMRMERGKGGGSKDRGSGMRREHSEGGRWRHG